MEQLPNQAATQRGPLAGIRVLDMSRVPAGLLSALHPHVQYRALKIDVPHPLAGSVSLVANPIKFSGAKQKSPSCGRAALSEVRDRGSKIYRFPHDALPAAPGT